MYLKFWDFLSVPHLVVIYAKNVEERGRRAITDPIFAPANEKIQNIAMVYYDLIGLTPTSIAPEISLCFIFGIFELSTYKPKKITEHIVAQPAPFLV